MARGAPVTIDDVEATLRDIEGAGIKPTVRLVHQKLGRGSMSTITAHLRAVAAARAGTEVGDLPDPVLASLRGAADTIWQELADAADARIEAVTAAADGRVRDAHVDRDAAQAALADARDERGALTATLAERDTRLATLEGMCAELTGNLVAAERQAALDERDRVSLAERLADRDTELGRALAALERADAARVILIDERDRLAGALRTETSRRDEEGVTREAAVARLHEALDRARDEIAPLATANARLEARAEAASELRDELSARTEMLRNERDAARTRAVVLDDRLEQARLTVTESRRSADGDRHEALALRAHAEQLRKQLRTLGADPIDVPPPPTPESSRAT